MQHVTPTTLIEKVETELAENPEFFVEDLLGDIPWEKQREILRALVVGREIAVKSCHAVGKSWIGARVVAWFLTSFVNSVVWTTAPTGRQVRNILWREIRAAIKNSDTHLGGEVLKERWELGEKWFGFGFATDQPEAFQGLHSESGYILGVVDEASGVDDKILEAAESTLTSEFAKLLTLGNPNVNSGYFAKQFKRKGVIKITISCFDTPNFIANNIRTVEDLRNCDVDKMVVVASHLITVRFAKNILEKYGPESNNFRVRCLAEFPLQGADTLISLGLLEKARHREVLLDPSADIVIACDPARFGDDRTAIIVRQGKKVLRKLIITHYRTTAVSGQIIALKKEFPKARIKIEVNGLGAGIVDEVHEWAVTNNCAKDVIEINVNYKAINEKEYANLRTEMYFNLRDWLADAEIPDDEDFLEVAEIKYHYTSKGQNQLESKDDIKKRIGKSPDVGDAMAISLAEVRNDKPIPRARLI